jgi:magnesium-transporting ATPase (P-type)
LNDNSATKDAVAESVVFLDATNIAFMGSNVVSGDGVGIVIATGSANQVFFLLLLFNFMHKIIVI